MFNQLWLPEGRQNNKINKAKIHVQCSSSCKNIKAGKGIREGSVTAPKQLSEGNLLHCTAEQTGQRINKRSMKY